LPIYRNVKTEEKIMERDHKMGLRRGREDRKKSSLEMPHTTFCKGHRDAEKQLENFIKCIVKICIYLDLAEYQYG